MEKYSRDYSEQWTERHEQSKWRRLTYWGWVLGQAEAALSPQHPTELMAKSCTPWWSPDRWTIDKTFITLRAAALPGPLHTAETRNHLTCTDKPWSCWSSQAETRFRGSRPCPELCKGRWAPSKGWAHPAHINHDVTSHWVSAYPRHEAPHLAPLEAAHKLSFILNTCSNPSGLVLSRDLKMCWEILAALFSTWPARCWKLHNCIHTGVLKRVN